MIKYTYILVSCYFNKNKKMKPKHFISLTLLVFIFFISENLFARFGGAGGHSFGSGSGGGYGFSFHGPSGYRYSIDSLWGFIFIVVINILGLLALLIVPIFILIKSKYSKKAFRKYFTSGTLWDYYFMKENAKKTFYKIQDVWRNQNIDDVKDIISSDLYTKYESIFSEMKTKGEKNIIGSISIEDVYIISCEDYKDDSKDKHIAYLSGTIRNYTIKETTNEIIKNPNRKLENFSEFYHFIRINDKWCLEEIDNSVKLWDILKARKFKEE